MMLRERKSYVIRVVEMLLEMFNYVISVLVVAASHDYEVPE